jgi:dTDP-4-dehydrorhamnose reductase
MHILVTGSKGQLGSEIQKISKNYTDYKFTYTDIDELDITSKKDVNKFVSDNNFDIIINCAAYTAVDKCETEKNASRKVNVIAVKNLAMACADNNISFIHISTDYVYDGKNHIPYKESDFTNPESYYGQTKLEGEQVIDEYSIKAVIIRTSWLYSSFGNNFVKTIIKHATAKDELNVVYDQIGTPTYAGDLATIILDNIKELELLEGINLYNFSNEGVCSWYDFAKEIVSLKNIKCNIYPIETKDYPLPAPRPAYSILNKDKIKTQLNTSIPYWKDSLKKCLKEL